jgi:hypothetical protein
MKLKTILITFLILSTLDLFSTFIALNFLTGIYESNPLAKSFFGYGFFGWITWIIITYIVIFCLSLFVFYMPKIGKKMGEIKYLNYEIIKISKETEEKIYRIMSLITFYAIFGIYIYLLINNFSIIIDRI